MSDDYRTEEKHQVIEAFADLIIDEFNENLAIDGLPTARNEHEAEGIGDVRAYLENREALKQKIVASFLEAWKKMEEIEKQ